MENAVLSILKTTFEASELERTLHTLLKSGTSDKQVLTSEAARLLSGDISKALVNEINTSKDIKVYLNTLIKAIEMIEVVYLSLAIEPTGEIIERMNLWLRKNTEKIVIMEFEYKPQLIAGAGVAYKGKFGDYSLEKRIDEYIEENKKDLAKEIIRHDAV